MVISFARTRLKSTIRDQFVSYLGTDHFVLEGGEGITGKLFMFLRSLFSASKKKRFERTPLFLYTHTKGGTIESE